MKIPFFKLDTNINDFYMLLKVIIPGVGLYPIYTVKHSFRETQLEQFVNNHVIKRERKHWAQFGKTTYVWCLVCLYN